MVVPFTLLLLGFLAVAVGLGIYELYHWLRYGDWAGVSGSDALSFLGLDPPTFAWDGLRQITTFLMGESAITLALIGIITMELLIILSGWLEK